MLGICLIFIFWTAYVCLYFYLTLICITNHSFPYNYPSGIKSWSGIFYSSILYTENNMQNIELSLWNVKGSRGCSHSTTILILEIAQDLRTKLVWWIKIYASVQTIFLWPLQCAWWTRLTPHGVSAPVGQIL